MDQLLHPLLHEDEVTSDEPKERRFNAYRQASSDKARAAIAEAQAIVEKVERERGLRRNKRRPYDQQTFVLTVAALISDLVYDQIMTEGAGLYVSRSKQVLGRRNRYRPRVWSKALPTILNTMELPEAGLIVQALGRQPMRGPGRATVILPGPKLLSLIEEHDLDFDDFEVAGDEEPVILKRTKDPEDYWDEGAYQEYDDTEETARIRSELQEINLWLAKAHIRFDRSTAPGVWSPVDIRNRHLRRIFTQGDFQSGGRLFGGFWQSMRKQERLLAIRINGEDIVELDYGQAGSRIVYGMAKQELPSGDHYTISRYGSHRDGIKRVMSAMLFAKDRLSRFPKDTRKLFHRGDRIADVVAAIEDKHPAIKHLFHQGIGHHAQFIESQIMVDVLLTLKREGIVALPIHDAILVPASAKPRSAEVMVSVFEKRTGVQAMVT